jgi:hypothetical protein
VAGGDDRYWVARNRWMPMTSDGTDILAAGNVTATVFTTRQGIIDSADPNGARLLNLPVKSCHGRDLIAWFARNRIDVMRSMEAAYEGNPVSGQGVIKPTERRPCSVRFELSVDPTDDRFLKWVFEAAERDLIAIPKPRQLRLVKSA